MAPREGAVPGIEGILIERVFEARPDLVWQAWTDGESFARWYGPDGFTVPVCQIDLRVGGRVLLSMQGPKDFEMWYTGTFKEVDPPRRFVRTEALANPEGNIVDASHYGMSEDLPRETLVTVVLEEIEPGRTKMTMRHEGLPAGMAEQGAQQGWAQAIEKLAAYLAGTALTKGVTAGIAGSLSQ